MFGHVVYQLANAKNSANSATALPSNSNDPGADWGPAANDVRHRLMFMFNTPLLLGVLCALRFPPGSVRGGLLKEGLAAFHVGLEVGLGNVRFRARTAQERLVPAHG